MILTAINKARKVANVALLKNQKGFTLTEILSAIVVSLLLVGMAAITLLTFFGKFKELSYYAQLQQDAFDAVETIKYGYPFQGVNEYLFLGVANANSVQLEGPGGSWASTFNSLTCIPDRSEQGHSNDYVRYYYDQRTQSIMVQGLYGVVFKQEQVFPTRNQDMIRVTQFRVSSMTGNSNPRLLTIEIDAELDLTGKQQQEQGSAEIKEKIKRVSYSTSIALGK
ncbi:MAG: prepilin-type N-terminal cleavage/methylation domain-containing protein [Candidatus Cloacimonas sp.]|jgi:prepilin-type N-terminal cleavage/methylation domain-containing protein|nr:prepilin-type N-terminal cleavage/methylation domain-containing protein [Candidatus Cloacimonadota bacterium]